MGNTFLRRYTNLAAAIHLLKNRQVTLLDPSTWDDKNDAFFMSEYQKKIRASSVLALCFADSIETYHHWRVFSHGSDGVCIEFDNVRLLKAFDSDTGVKHGPINYTRLSDARRMTDIDIEVLPYLKRWPYGDEAEYRAVYVDKRVSKPIHDVPIPLNSINRITLSTWLAASLSDSVKSLLKSIEDCCSLEICRSTLIDNKVWKGLAGKAPPVVPYSP